MAHLKQVYRTNIIDTDLKPRGLLNELCIETKIKKFPNVCIALRIFCTLPVSISSNERSFSKLAIIKNKFRNSTNQDRLVSIDFYLDKIIQLSRRNFFIGKFDPKAPFRGPKMAKN